MARDASSSRTVRLATWLYARAAGVLPREFRARYGAELVVCFEGIAAEARRRSRSAVAGVTARSIVDLLTRAPKEHLGAARAGALGAGSGWLASAEDVRQAGRRLLRRPGFAIASIVTLALGIGAATSVFSLVHGVVLSPLPYPDADRIVAIDHSGEGVGIESGLGVTYGFFRFYRERTRSAESMAMYVGYEMPLTGEGEPVRLRVTGATPSLMAVLGTKPLLGRWFTESEGERGAAVTVVSHRLWRERLGSDPNVVGRVIRLGDIPHEVIGVMPPWFSFPDDATLLWRPLQVPSTGIGGWNRMAVARLGEGATPASLEAELTSLLPVLRENNDDPERVTEYLDDARARPRIVPLKESLVGDVRATLWILLGTVGVVLLIAVANVANLFLVRAEDGQRERALRTALGADRTRLIRGFLAETLLLAGAAGILGIAAAALAVRVLRLHAPVSIPRLSEVGLDPVVLAVAVGTCVLAALLLGLIPSLRKQGSLPAALKEGGRRTTAGRARLRGRNVLVATQVALALILLIGSGLLVRTFQELRAVELGFTSRQALTFEIGLPSSRYGEPAEAKAFHDALLERLRGLAGVERAGAVAHCLPLAGHLCWGDVFEAEGRPTPAGQVPPITGYRKATPGYFESIGIPVRGRTFTSADADGPPVAILSESTARAYFGEEDPIGRRIRTGDHPWMTVVGLASDVRTAVASEENLRVLYEPLRPEAGPGPPPTSVIYVLRTAVPPTTLVPSVRRAVAAIDPLIPVGNVQSLRELIDRATAPTAFALTLIGLASFIALLLGAVGVYGVIAYTVSRRTAEIGVRMAIGAAAGDVRRMVLRQGGGVVLVGIVAGLAGAVVLTRLMEGLLYGVSPTDPVSYALLTLLMLGIAGMALYLPARRASRVDPMEALRTE